MLLDQTLIQPRISRRRFLKFCAATASLLALPPVMIPRIVEALEQASRQPVIWLSFQECTGCTESFTRADVNALETLLFEYISLDYHHTLQAVAGETAERVREEAIQTHQGHYLLIVEGAIPLAHPGYSTIAGTSNVEILKQTAQGAQAIIAVGSCAAFGGIPHALPNPTGAVSVDQIITDKPIVKVSGCPPIPMVISSVIMHFIIFGTLPELDKLKRPLAFFGRSIHSRCHRRSFFERGLFAKDFNDSGAKQGWCLYQLGCKGPTTYNACAMMKWNESTSFPIEAGHGCLGCSEPDFWDAGSFYRSLDSPLSPRTLPNLGQAVATDKVGVPVTTTTYFAGGVAINSGSFHRQLTLHISEAVEISANMTVEPAHVEQAADILVFVAYKPLLTPNENPASYFMLNATGEILSWDEEPTHLVAFETTVLKQTQPVPIYQGLLMTTGTLAIYLGYRLSDGMLVTTSQPIEVVIVQ